MIDLAEANFCMDTVDRNCMSTPLLSPLMGRTKNDQLTAAEKRIFV
jgi:hypothetical protein